MLYSGKLLASLSDVKDHLGITDDESNAQLLMLTEWASRFVERETHQPQAITAATIKIPAYSSTVLRLPFALQELTKVTNGDDDATVISSTDFDLLPYTGPPYYRIKANTNASTLYKSPVTLEGSWGLSTDTEIKLAVILTVSRALNEMYEDGIATASTDFANESFQREVKFNPMMKSIIVSHRPPIALG